MQLPLSLLNSLEKSVGFDRKAFEEVHRILDQVVSIRLNPHKATALPLLSGAEPVLWSQFGYYLPQRPSFTFDPLFHAGCYYVQEASSMFLEQAIKQLTDAGKPLKVLDLCAAPGGKSTHIQSLLPEESIIVSNEVIRSRVGVLRENIVKWGCSNIVVTNNDPRDFSKLENYFDLVIVDAPCSGSGLFRRDPAALLEWSEANVTLCSQRQQRILAGAWPAVKKGGYLIYSTCSYSAGEDEEIVGWMMNEWGARYCPLELKKAWHISEGPLGYRFWPNKLKGEGFFLAAVQKTEGEEATALRSPKLKPAPARATEVVREWMEFGDRILIENGNELRAWPAGGAKEFAFLSAHLRVVYSGVEIGTLLNKKLIPAHSLALSGKVHAGINRIELDYDSAIRYLQRKDMAVGGNQRGFQLVTYQHQPLGWVNLLPNRLNNYYPKELRIRKERPN